MKVEELLAAVDQELEEARLHEEEARLQEEKARLELDAAHGRAEQLTSERTAIEGAWSRHRPVEAETPPNGPPAQPSAEQPAQQGSFSSAPSAAPQFK